MSAPQLCNHLAVPTARVVRDGSGPVPKPPLRHQLRDRLTLSDRGRQRLAVVLGLWPLILVGSMALALLWSAGYHSVQP